jgi:hypothetical protein
MRMVFGVLGLLVTLAIVGVLAKKALQPLQLPAPDAAGASAPVLQGTPAQQSRQLQNQVKDDVNKLMQQAPARAEPAQ